MQDIPKLYTAFAEWLSCVTLVLAYRKYLELERRTTRIGIMAVTLAVLCVLQALCGMVSNWLWQLGMLAAVSVMTVCLKYSLEIGWNSAIYLSARVFMRAEFLAALEWQVFSFYFGGKAGTVSPEAAEQLQVHLSGGSPGALLFCLAVYLAGFGLFYYIERRNLSEDFDRSRLSVSGRQTVMVWLTTVLIFALSNLSFIEVRTPFTGTDSAEIFNIRALFDMTGVLMLELFQMQKKETDRRQEMSAIQNVLMNHYLQYQESQENIDLLNQKYHDLKHQLQILRSEPNQAQRDTYLNEIEQGIAQYDDEIKTGNPVLDTVLTNKSNLCRKHGITLTAVVDGSLLTHLHVMDLCAIFGNALDNAIEYEMQVQEEEKRLIHVSVARKGNFVGVVVENYYEGTFTPEDSLPQTTKGDRRYHGYGLKSIRYSVRKYGGHFNIAVRDHWFRLEMLFPKGREGA